MLAIGASHLVEC